MLFSAVRIEGVLGGVLEELLALEELDSVSELLVLELSEELLSVFILDDVGSVVCYMIFELGVACLVDFDVSSLGPKIMSKPVITISKMAPAILPISCSFFN